MKINLAVFASGKGSNFLAIAEAVKNGKIKEVNLALLVCDNPAAPVILKAKKFKVKAVLVERNKFLTKADFEKKIIQYLKENKVDVIALAGFMRLLSPEFVRLYKGRVINIHPALLPAFKGASGIKDAFDYGVKLTGVTVHFVDEKTDHGPVILQEGVRIEEDDTLGSLEKKIHKIEHSLYPKAISLLVEKRLKTAGRKVRIINL